MPVFMAKHNELKLQEQGQEVNMLGTIKMPMNIKQIHENLPGSNYDTDKQKKKQV
jgi:hypothetical protein